MIIVFIIIFQHTCTFLNENIINDQQIQLNEINTYSYFAVAMINKQPICHAGKSVYQGKRKTKFSFHKYAKRYVPKTFCSVPKAFCFVPKAFRFVLNAPCFVQTFQRSPCVVVRIRVCGQDKGQYISLPLILFNRCFKQGYPNKKVLC